MIIPNSTLTALNTTFSTRFRGAYKDTPSWWQRLAMRVPSTTPLNTYGWMARIGKMRKWIGERIVNNLSAYAYALVNLPYEFTIGVLKDDIEDDTLGVYQPMFAEMGRITKKWPDQMLKEAMQAGTTTTTFDGVAFFSTAHVLGALAAQSNLHAGTALSAANLDTVLTAMASRVGEDGEPIGVTGTLLVVPPQLALTARNIVNASILASGASNMQENVVDILVVPELANEPTVWYVIDASGEIKPFVVQIRREPGAPETPRDTEFWRREVVWGVDGRGVAGYGPWWLASRAAA